MSATTKKHSTNERLDVLLALAIAHSKRANVNDAETETEPALLMLSALNEPDAARLREQAANYEKLTAEERQVWQARSLSRVQNRTVLLDKDVHNTQIADVLRVEPEYIQTFILRNLPRETADDAAPLLGVSIEDNGADVAVNPHLKNLVRRCFLSNFVTRESLAEQTPLAHLSGEQLLLLLQRLGQYEIALVCRGIKEIENLAPFLRQFGDFDAQKIVEMMANIKIAKRRRIEQAENLVKEAWTSEPEPVLVTQLIGIWKLSAALTETDDLHVRYITQKLPLNIAEKMLARITEIGRKISEGDAEIGRLTRLFAGEAETNVKQMLLEAIQISQPQVQPTIEEAATEETLKEETI